MTSSVGGTARTGVIGERVRPPEFSVSLSNGSVTAEILPERGGSIGALSIDGVPVLVSYRADGKYNTSHPMFPFSRNNPYLPVHGAIRFTPHRMLNPSSDRISVEGTDVWSGAKHCREVRLLRTGIEATSWVDTSEANGTQHTSYGNHFYIPAPQPDQVHIATGSQRNATLKARRPNGQLIVGTLPELLARQDIQGSSEEAETYMLLTEGDMTLVLPGITLKLASKCLIHSGDGQPPIEVPVMPFLWHDRRSGTICIEPIAGARITEEGQLITTGLELNPGQLLQFVTKITKVAL